MTDAAPPSMVRPSEPVTARSPWEVSGLLSLSEPHRLRPYVAPPVSRIVSSPGVALARATASRSERKPSEPSITSAFVVTVITAFVAPAGAAAMAGTRLAVMKATALAAIHRFRLIKPSLRSAVVPDDVDDDVGRTVLVLEVDRSPGTDLDGDQVGDGLAADVVEVRPDRVGRAG